jgi:hypothetical protein
MSEVDGALKQLVGLGRVPATRVDCATDPVVSREACC